MLMLAIVVRLHSNGVKTIVEFFHIHLFLFFLLSYYQSVSEYVRRWAQNSFHFIFPFFFTKKINYIIWIWIKNEKTYNSSVQARIHIHVEHTLHIWTKHAKSREREASKKDDEKGRKVWKWKYARSSCTQYTLIDPDRHHRICNIIFYKFFRVAECLCVALKRMS